MGRSEPPVALADRWRPGPPPVLLCARCRPCGRVSFPPQPHCPACWEPTETTELPTQGTLYTFTVVHTGSGTPRALGYADLGEVRVLGQLTGGPPAIGLPVTVTETTTGPPGSPSRVYGFRVRGP